MKKKYEFCITAHIDEDAMILLRGEYDRNIVFDDGDVLRMAKRNMPFAKWVLNDGGDEAYTDYCLYVFFPEEDNTDNYICAGWDCHYL
jgi:hypothetical protein